MDFLKNFHKTLLFGLIIILCSWESAKAAVLVADTIMSRMIELNAKAPYCTYHTDRGTIQKMLLASDQRRVRQMTNSTFASLIEICRTTRTNKGAFIYPGTKWCGPGNSAKSYNDLGDYKLEDQCCREHDHCPNIIESGNCKNGICNNSPFTRSHCDCDEKFRKCLQTLNTEVANAIGTFYFNIAQVICFRERPPCTQLQSNIPNYVFHHCKYRYYRPIRYKIIRHHKPTIKIISNTTKRKSPKSNRLTYHDRELIVTYGLILRELFQDLE